MLYLCYVVYWLNTQRVRRHKHGLERATRHLDTGLSRGSTQLCASVSTKIKLRDCIIFLGKQLQNGFI